VPRRIIDVIGVETKFPKGFRPFVSNYFELEESIYAEMSEIHTIS
jgi:hypothetical protein